MAYAHVPVFASQQRTTCADPVTGCRLHRLTHGGVNVSPYFSNGAWTPEGDAVIFLHWADGRKWICACAVDTGQCWPLFGPFTGPEDTGLRCWPTLKMIPGTRAATFVADRAVWRAEFDGTAQRIAELPPGDFDIGDTDVSGDGRWHYVNLIPMTADARRDWPDPWWPPDAYYATHQLFTRMLRVDLQSGAVEELWHEPAVADHLYVNPRDSDLVLYNHQGERPFRYGHMFLRRVGESTSRPLRDQRSGRVWVTHTRWFADGTRIAYHGHYLVDHTAPPAYYVGIFDVERDLPLEYPLSDPALAPWHCNPAPDGTRLAVDQMGGQRGGIFLLTLNSQAGQWHVARLTSLHSDVSPLPAWFWHEQNPIWSPDGRRLLFTVARDGSSDLYLAECP